MKAILCLALVAATYALPQGLDIHPLSDEFIDLINSKQSAWKAGRNFHVNTSMEDIRTLVGTLKSPVQLLPTREPIVEPRETIPTFFDARDQWPECKSIGEVRDQANCGSCWAFGAVEAMTDRICIHSKGEKQVRVSAQDLLTCCATCGYGCNGGYLAAAWRYWAENGISTGGLYGETDGCKSYSLEPCAHHVEDSKLPACSNVSATPACVQQCDNNELVYKSELTFGDLNTIYNVPMAPDQIQLEILRNGPVETAFDVYEDFLSYKSGVYIHVAGELLGGHAIKLLGWGEEGGFAYWLAANSWNTDWGDEGFFKILRRGNYLGFEGNVITGLPLM